MRSVSPLRFRSIYPPLYSSPGAATTNAQRHPLCRPRAASEAGRRLAARCERRCGSWPAGPAREGTTTARAARPAGLRGGGSAECLDAASPSYSGGCPSMESAPRRHLRTSPVNLCTDNGANEQQKSGLFASRSPERWSSQRPQPQLARSSARRPGNGDKRRVGPPLSRSIGHQPFHPFSVVDTNDLD